MRTFSQELLAVASLLLTAPTACGFAPTPTKLSHVTHPRAPVNDNPASVFSGGVVLPPSPGQRDVSMALSLDVLDMIITSGIFGAAVYATIKLSGESDVEDSMDSGSSPEVVTTPKSAETAEEKDVLVVEEAEVAVVEEKIEEVVAEAPASEPVPAVVEVASGTETPKAEEKDISQLRNEVASTLEEQREKERRLRDAKKQREAQKPPAVAAEPTSESVAVVEAPEKAEDEAPESAEDEVDEKKTRFVGKLIKKAIMPWRKWSNL